MQHPILDNIIEESDKKMQSAINNLSLSLNSLRASRVTPDILNHIKIEAYDSFMPLKELATVSIIEGKMLSIQPWDKDLLKAIAKGISASELGFSAVVDGDKVRVAIPALNEERRKELAKTAEQYGENSKIAIRHIRRDAIQTTKAEESISEDQIEIYLDKIQKKTDKYIVKIDELTTIKKKEIMTV